MQFGTCRCTNQLKTAHKSNNGHFRSTICLQILRKLGLLSVDKSIVYLHLMPYIMSGSSCFLPCFPVPDKLDVACTSLSNRYSMSLRAHLCLLTIDQSIQYSHLMPYIMSGSSCFLPCFPVPDKLDVACTSLSNR